MRQPAENIRLLLPRFHETNHDRSASEARKIVRGLNPSERYHTDSTSGGPLGSSPGSGYMERTTWNVTELLAELRRGDKRAVARLLPIVYGELRRLAGGHIRGSARNTSTSTAVRE